MGSQSRQQRSSKAALLITTVVAIALTYANLSAGGITVFDWLAQIASTGYFMVWVVIAITSFRFRAALKAQNDPLFTKVHAWKCSFWPLPPIWLLVCCSLYVACSFYLALYPIVSALITHYRAPLSPANIRSQIVKANILVIRALRLPQHTTSSNTCSA